MSNDCGTTTPDGNAVCIPSTPSQTRGCGCSPKVQTSQPTPLTNPLNKQQPEQTHVAKNS